MAAVAGGLPRSAGRLVHPWPGVGEEVWLVAGHRRPPFHAATAAAAQSAHLAKVPSKGESQSGHELRTGVFGVPPDVAPLKSEQGCSPLGSLYPNALIGKGCCSEREL